MDTLLLLAQPVKASSLLSVWLPDSLASGIFSPGEVVPIGVILPMHRSGQLSHVTFNWKHSDSSGWTTINLPFGAASTKVGAPSLPGSYQLDATVWYTAGTPITEILISTFEIAGAAAQSPSTFTIPEVVEVGTQVTPTVASADEDAIATIQLTSLSGDAINTEAV